MTPRGKAPPNRPPKLSPVGPQLDRAGDGLATVTFNTRQKLAHALVCWPLAGKPPETVVLLRIVVVSYRLLAPDLLRVGSLFALCPRKVSSLLEALG